MSGAKQDIVPSASQFVFVAKNLSSTSASDDAGAAGMCADIA